MSLQRVQCALQSPCREESRTPEIFMYSALATVVKSTCPEREAPLYLSAKHDSRCSWLPRVTCSVPLCTGSAGCRRTSRRSSFEMCSQDPKHPRKNSKPMSYSMFCGRKLTALQATKRRSAIWRTNVVWY